MEDFADKLFSVLFSESIPDSHVFFNQFGEGIEVFLFFLFFPFFLFSSFFFLNLLVRPITCTPHRFHLTYPTKLTSILYGNKRVSWWEGHKKKKRTNLGRSGEKKLIYFLFVLKAINLE